MDLNVIFLICAALLPAIALCIYVFKKDRVEKEPIGLLLGLLALGCLICWPAAEIETVLSGIIDKIFIPFTYEEEGVVYLSEIAFKAYNAINNFIGIALVEEGLKFIALFLATRNNKNFNSLFDGLIYAVFVSLGFAAFENVLYVVSYGWTNALVRAVTAVPGHMFFAVLMGYYYSMWHVCEQAKTMERALKKRGLVDKNSKEISGKHHLICSLLVPVLAHGLYDYCCTSETVWADIVFYALLIFLYVYCFKRIKEMSKGDMEDKRFAAVMVFKKYPHLLEALRLETEQIMRSQVNS